MGELRRPSQCIEYSDRCPANEALQAERHKVKLLILPTIKAIEALQQDPENTNASFT